MPRCVCGHSDEMHFAGVKEGHKLTDFACCRSGCPCDGWRWEGDFEQPGGDHRQPDGAERPTVSGRVLKPSGSADSGASAPRPEQDARPDAGEPDLGILREYERRKLAYTEAIWGRLAWEADKSTVEVTSEEVDAAEHWLDVFVTTFMSRRSDATLEVAARAPEVGERERVHVLKTSFCWGYLAADKSRAPFAERQANAEAAWAKDSPYLTGDPSVARFYDDPTREEPARDG